MGISRTTYFIGIGVYLLLALFSILFYMERIVFLDCAFSVFHMAKDNSFSIQIFRFGDAFSRILPLLGVKLGLPLSVISIAYSMGFIVFYFACYLLCGLYYRQYGYALVILLVNILFVTDSFYWPTAQVPQAIALTMILFSAIHAKQLRSISIATWLLIIALITTIVFFHPLMLAVLFYLIIFFMLGKKEDNTRTNVLLTLGLIYLGILAIKMIFFRAEYERHSLSGLKNFVTLFPHYFNTYAVHNFLYSCLTKYYWIPITFILVLVKYITAKDYKKLLFFACVTIGYLMLVNTCYPNSATPQFYIEVHYLPLGLFLGVPLVFDVLPFFSRQYVFALVLLIATSGAIRIYAAHDVYTQRLNWERAFLKKHGDKKMIVNSHKIDASALQMLWGTPYEFWLLSAIENHKLASIIIDDNPKEREWANQKNKALIVNWNVFPYSTLNPLYFPITDTITGYLIDPDLE
jgi:hypothetical protein